MTNTTTGRFYPQMPPALEGESSEDYTKRLMGASGSAPRPYDHKRNRQCSIGYHDECSDPEGESCECPCHRTESPSPRHDDPRPFALLRDVDDDEVSGTGRVARGVQFGDGTCAIRWETESPSTGFYDDISDVVRIHGHGGKTRIVWIGDEG